MFKINQERFGVSSAISKRFVICPKIVLAVKDEITMIKE